MDRNRVAKTETANNPVPAETKITLVASVFAVNLMAITVLNHPAAQEDQPEISNADAQQQPLDAAAMSQPGCMQVEATAFHIAEHGPVT